MQMPHSLRVRIKRMRYKGYITDNDCQRLCDALDIEQAVKDAIAEIEQIELSGYVDEKTMFIRTADQVKTMVLNIIDRHIGERTVSRHDT